MDMFPLITVSKQIKHPEINLNKDVRDLNSENFKFWKKEIEEDTRKWENITFLWIVKLIFKNNHSTKSNLQIQYKTNQTSQHSS